MSINIFCIASTSLTMLLSILGEMLLANSNTAIVIIQVATQLQQSLNFGFSKFKLV